MATKKPEDPGKALAALESEAALAEAMQKLMAEKGWSIQDVMGAFGLKAVAKGVERAGTRKAQKSRFEAAEVDLEPEDEEVLRNAEKVIAEPLPMPNGALTQEEIDLLAVRVKPIRRGKDTFEGREKAIRAALFAHFDAVEGEGKSGKVVSIVGGIRFERSVTNKSTYDIEALKAALTPAQRKKVIVTETVVEEKVDDEALARLAMEKPEVMAALQAAVVPNVREVFYVRDLKPGDEVE